MKRGTGKESNMCMVSGSAVLFCDLFSFRGKREKSEETPRERERKMVQLK